MAPVLFVAGAIFRVFLDGVQKPLEFWVIMVIIAVILPIILSDLLRDWKNHE